MSMLDLHNRPWTVFDVGNRDHRRWYYEFVEHGTWGRCPYRFVVPEPHDNLVNMIQRKLVEYYVNREFTKGRKK